MERSSEGSIYILSNQQGFPEGRIIEVWGRIPGHCLLELDEYGRDVRVFGDGKVRDFSSSIVFKDEVLPVIEPDSFRDSRAFNIGEYTGSHIIQVIETARLY